MQSTGIRRDGNFDYRNVFAIGEKEKYSD